MHIFLVSPDLVWDYLGKPVPDR